MYQSLEESAISTNPSTEPSSLILIVDDDALIRLQLRLYLQKEKYRVVEASDGLTGLAAYEEVHPDLILLDAVMPTMDGFACCQKLSEVPESDRPPILMITSLEDKESVDRAFAAGAADYITKPIHWAVLGQRVRRLIQQFHLQQQQTLIYKQLEAANRQLKYLASIDGLTQIANRRQFDEQLEHEWRRMMRQQTPLSLILCDIDFFKPYNDTYGHQAGDVCLQQVAAALNRSINRAGDLAARYGGEEFVVILPDTELEGAVHIVKKIQARIQALAIVHKSSPHHCITLSFGITTVIPTQESLPETLITAADAALYQAKDQGRNTFCTKINTINEFTR
ncbi:diguanylate cyclase response regulator [Microcoleus vaginatus PCC 9802]|uniref:GGDEF domain-containing response regulator n=1 Tax=Microcoleus vaginatus TaxID=119532 RepID=UPI00020D1A44|nr:response regulator receiver modulated diguanylate cyclase [Microcoleus vaginatus FGP-2]UNU19000.1 diguanylate cyclase response regulator [Microcoleus vaginatus PCC 9802]